MFSFLSVARNHMFRLFSQMALDECLRCVDGKSKSLFMVRLQ